MQKDNAHVLLAVVLVVELFEHGKHLRRLPRVAGVLLRASRRRESATNKTNLARSKLAAYDTEPVR